MAGVGGKHPIHAVGSAPVCMSQRSNCSITDSVRNLACDEIVSLCLAAQSTSDRGPQKSPAIGLTSSPSVSWCSHRATRCKRAKTLSPPALYMLYCVGTALTLYAEWCVKRPCSWFTRSGEGAVAWRVATALSMSLRLSNLGSPWNASQRGSSSFRLVTCYDALKMSAFGIPMRLRPHIRRGASCQSLQKSLVDLQSSCQRTRVPF